MTKKRDQTVEAENQSGLAAAPSERTEGAQAQAGELPASDAPAPSSPAALPPEQIDELKTKAAKADEYWDRLLRSAAELENYKKRVARERQEAVKYANESLMERLIPVLDNLDMALAAAAAPQADSLESIKTGVSMIHNQFKSVLTESGLEEIDALKQPFDANLHEAVSQQESTEVAEGHVLQQLRKGYKLRDRLIRPAMVVVAKKSGTS